MCVQRKVTLFYMIYIFINRFFCPRQRPASPRPALCGLIGPYLLLHSRFLSTLRLGTPAAVAACILHSICPGCSSVSFHIVPDTFLTLLQTNTKKARVLWAPAHVGGGENQPAAFQQQKHSQLKVTLKKHKAKVMRRFVT